jgi:hypothetical protein
MNKTAEQVKQATIMFVLNYLSKDDSKEKFCKKLSGEDDLDSAYKIANRYARKYIHHKVKEERDKFLSEVEKLADKWVANGNKWLEQDYSDYVVIEENAIANSGTSETEIVTVETLGNGIVNECDEAYIEKITESDNDIENRCNNRKKEEMFSTLLITAFIDNNINKVKREFLDRFNVKKELIGYKDGVEVYYCEGINGVFQIV